MYRVWVTDENIMQNTLFQKKKLYEDRIKHNFERKKVE